MASSSFNALAVPTSVAAGAWLTCDSIKDGWITVFGTFSATVQLQYTVATDADPVNIGAAITAPGQVQIPLRVKKVRANVTAYTSGTPQAVLSSEG
jgi:uncharacterized membrane protein